jgi:hypothetical protein
MNGRPVKDLGLNDFWDWFIVLLLVKPVWGENGRIKERGCRPSEVKGLRFAPIPSSALAPEWTSP